MSFSVNAKNMLCSRAALSHHCQLQWRNLPTATSHLALMSDRKTMHTLERLMKATQRSVTRGSLTGSFSFNAQLIFTWLSVSYSSLCYRCFISPVSTTVWSNQWQYFWDRLIFKEIVWHFGKCVAFSPCRMRRLIPLSNLSFHCEATAWSCISIT